MSSATTSSPTVSQRSVFNPTDEEKAEMPWMYIGYPGFSKWSGQSEDALVVRIFQTLAARTLLHSQWELSELERELETLDSNRKERALGPLHNGRFAIQDPQLTAHLHKIRNKLQKYCKLTFTRCFSESSQKPTDAFVAACNGIRERREDCERSRNNILSWLCNHDQPIEAEDLEYLQKDDLIDVTHLERSPLRAVLERFSAFNIVHRLCRFKDHTDKELTTYTTRYSHARVDSFVNALVCLMGFALLVAPMWILLALGGNKSAQLGVITVFILLFLAGVQAVSECPRPTLSLAATVA
jgi:hypothetical protein